MTYNQQTFEDGHVLHAQDLNKITKNLADVDRLINGYSSDKVQDLTVDLTDILGISNYVARATTGEIIDQEGRLGGIFKSYNAASISIEALSGYEFNLVYFSVPNVNVENSMSAYLGALDTKNWSSGSKTATLPEGCQSIYINIKHDNPDSVANFSTILKSITLQSVNYSTVGLLDLVKQSQNNGYVKGEKYRYSGPPIEITPKEGVHTFSRSLFTTMPGMTTGHQGMIIHGKYLLYFMYRGSSGAGTSVYVRVYNFDTQTYIGQFNLPSGNFKIPHCNTVNCGIDYYPGNTLLPLIYLSQWDYDSERGILVYNIDPENLTGELIQVIKPNCDTTVFGTGATDWVADTDEGDLYSFTYARHGTGANNNTEHPSGAVVRDSKTMACKFKLPAYTEGADTSITNDSVTGNSYTIKVVTLTDEDMTDHYELPIMLVSQDKVYSNGKVYVGCGAVGYGEDTLCIRVIDLKKKAQVNCVPINLVTHSEPEGLDIWEGHLIMGFNGHGVTNFGDLWEWHF